MQPIFARHCYGCHGAEKSKARLRLDVRAVTLIRLTDVHGNVVRKLLA